MVGCSVVGIPSFQERTRGRRRGVGGGRRGLCPGTPAFQAVHVVLDVVSVWVHVVPAGVHVVLDPASAWVHLVTLPTGGEAILPG